MAQGVLYDIAAAAQAATQRSQKAPCPSDQDEYATFSISLGLQYFLSRRLALREQRFGCRLDASPAAAYLRPDPSPQRRGHSCLQCELYLDGVEAQWRGRVGGCVSHDA